MYPISRLVLTSIKALRENRSKPALSFNDVSETSFLCRPWDLDMFMEMNNGRVITLFDIGRFHLAIRSGLSAVLKREGWGLVVAGSTIRYRKRVRLFDKVTMRTQVIGNDNRWVYICQSMWVKGEAASSILLRTGVTEKGKVIDPERVKEAMGTADLTFPESKWLQEWITSEEDRPWPPQP